jgi:hypothetical protein
MLAPSRLLAAAAASLALALVAASSALAAGPATVSVRVEGVSETKLPLTQVTTNAQPVVKDGKPEDSCPGTNAVGALELATGGNWSGQWFSGLGYTVETVLGESHAFGSGAYWDEWYGHRVGSQGVCEHEPQAGEEILLFPCSETAPECPVPLAIKAQTTATVGEPVPLEVVKYDPEGKSSNVAGATVSGASAPALTDASGSATLTFASPGEFTLSASAPQAVRAEASICVHAPGDGGCGTSTAVPSAATSTSQSGALGLQSKATPPYKGPYAVVAQITGLAEHHVYSRRSAPRVLSGTVSAHVAVAGVSIALRRSYRGRCFAYNGLRERFVPAACGTAPFFAVSKSASFSYLLPAALGPGRYVFDVQAVDSAGNRTTLARGTSRIVFFVR